MTIHEFDSINDAAKPLPRGEVCLAALLSLAVALAAHHMGLANPFAGNDDLRQQVFWMQRFVDPCLYPNDPFAHYAELYVPYGIKALYFLASPVFDPILFSKLLTCLLFGFLGACLYGTGFTLGGSGLAWTTTCVYWLMPSFLHNMSGGLSRAFAAPLLALFLLVWLRRNAIGMAAALMLQALFIPYICILSTGACLLAALAGRRRAELAPPFPGKAWHLAWICLAALAVWFTGRQFDAAGFGPLVGRADMAGRPEFGALGRFEIYPQPGIFFDALYYPLERVGLFLDIGLAAGIVSLTAIVGLAVYFGRKADWRGLYDKSRPILFLLAASLILYTVARLVILKLFVPDRYLSYTLYIVYTLVLAACFHAGLARVIPTPKKTALAVLLAAALSYPRLAGMELYDYSGDAALYRAAWATPNDTVFAGPPGLMDNLLTFGKRKVFVSYKLAHPWAKGWWTFVEPRLTDFFKAYYAGDPQAVREFCRKNGIDFLVVDPKQYEPDFIAGRPFFAPFDSLIRDVAAGGKFALLDSREFPYQALENGLRLIDMRGGAKEKRPGE